MLQKLLLQSLSKAALNRRMLSIDSGSIALASDLGLKRIQNQDKVSVMKFSFNQKAYTLVALADGMGGMRDGKECAELCIAAFFASAIELTHLSSAELLRTATLATNKAVHEFSNGKGGCTLSAVLFGSDLSPVSVNVGDSRIYGRSAVSNRLIRLSVDDSLAEVVGGSGTELLQFIGMGDGLSPHVAPLIDDVEQVYLTTDGVHYIEPQTLALITENTEKVTQVVERLIATARWCGGPDNASICAIDIPTLNFNHRDNSAVIELTDPFGATQFIWAMPPKEKVQIELEAINSKPSIPDSNQPDDLPVLLDKEQENPKKRTRRTSKKKNAKNENENDEMKLTLSSEDNEVNNEAAE
ncbi:MAG: serine/threonine-protein phosphatase [Aliivibrio sp.]|uniref:PP2C family protein-serine/threonine phosphatase n=1 Tax=Aliivibrio sp. TaxID=1872443 RepID=UPI001A5AD706|nr:serine/threonine-protein phosphatase [Aliivibrio sp.]